MPRDEPVGAVLALWNDVDPALADDYEHWHRHEHVPERCTVPGLYWGLRWALDEQGPGPRFLTLYGLRDVEVLTEPGYQRLLREPTPASRRMRPALRQVQRWVCAVPGCATRVDARRAEDAQVFLRHLHGADRLWQWTSARPPAAGTEADPRTNVTSPAAVWLERLADVAPLPWLSADPQRATTSAAGAPAASGGPADAWLALATAPAAAPDPAVALTPTRRWRALPVGDGAPRA